MFGLASFEFPSILQVIFVTVMNKILPFIITHVKVLLGIKQKEPELIVKDWKNDVVYLVQFPRTSATPNPSPFCIKVETYLRANKIQYEVLDTVTKRSKHKLLPFIELNGRHIADSQLILIELAKSFNIQDYASKKDAAIGRAISRTADQHTFHVINYFKILEHPADFLSFLIASIVNNPVLTTLAPLAMPIAQRFFSQKVRRRIAMSLGVFPRDQMVDLLNKDLEIFEELLSEHKYFFGDRPTEADITVFSHLVSTTCIPVESLPKQYIADGKYPRLAKFLDSLRQEVWGDAFAQQK